MIAFSHLKVDAKLRRKPRPGRSTGRTSFAAVVGAILVNAPTLKGWYLLQGQAVPISRTTGMYALLFSGLNRCKGERGEIGVARAECSRIQWQKECEDDGKWPLAMFHGLAPQSKNTASLEWRRHTSLKYSLYWSATASSRLPIAGCSR